MREGVSFSVPTHSDMRDFDDKEFPLAYLISFRTYGTWLHGDKRGSMDRKHNVYGTSKISPNPALELRIDCEAPTVNHFIDTPPTSA